MTRMVIGSVFLLAAMVSPEIRPSTPAQQSIAAFQPTSRVSAQATASVTIISGARFGPGIEKVEAGGTRRKAQLTEADGFDRSAELLEFQ